MFLSAKSFTNIYRENKFGKFVRMADFTLMANFTLSARKKYLLVKIKQK